MLKCSVFFRCRVKLPAAVQFPGLISAQCTSISCTHTETKERLFMMKKQTFILLGATGSLAGKKIYPALGRLYRDGYLNHSEFRLIGVSFEEKTQEEFRHYVREKSAACVDGKQADTFQYFSESCTGEIVYVQIDILLLKRQ